MSGELFAPSAVKAVSMSSVVKTLRKTRLKKAGLSEFEIRDQLHEALAQAGLPSKTEVKFGPGCRADIWVDGIVVEVKKKRPDRSQVSTQLHRYARQPDVRGMILVLERSIVLPEEIEGKRIEIVSLNALWGVAL